MNILAHIFIAALLVTPILLGAQGLIVCDGITNPCDFEDLVRLGMVLVDFLIILSTALAAIVFAYAGFILLSSGGSEEKKTQAKKMFSKTAMGFIFVLAAWLIVNTIVSALVGDEFILLRN